MACCCDYANARIRAMAGRLLGQKGITDLLAQPSLAARLDYLKRTAYGESLAAHLMREPDSLRAAERAVGAQLSTDLLQINRFLRGEPVLPLFHAVLGFEDAWTLKTVLRGIAQGEPPDRIFTLVAPTPEFDDPALGELVRQKDVKAVVDLLTTWRSAYGSPLTSAFARYRTHRELFLLEVALDQFVFSAALHAARADGEDGEILLQFLENHIDLANVGTLLKRADGGRCDDLFIPGGRSVSLHRFQQLSSLKEKDLREALVASGRPQLDSRLAAIDGAVPFTVDQILQQTLRKAIEREARVHPLSLAVPLSFMLERRAEVQRIRLVLRGAEFGVPAAELVALVEL
jgi:V/A-type H+/Na+-transporting ATPase subunit C